MQYFNGAKNPLLKKSTNSLKLEGNYTREIELRGNVYGREFLLPLPKDIDELSKLDIILTLNINPIMVGCRCDQIGYKFLKTIILETKKGGKQLFNSGSNVQMYFDNKFQGLPVSSYINSCTFVDLDKFMNTGTVTVILPFFSFFTMNTNFDGTVNPKSFLKIRDTEDLQFRIITNSIEGVGMWTNVDPPDVSELIPFTSVSLYMRQQSFNHSATSNKLFLNNVNITVPRVIENTFNMFYEDSMTIPAGQTTQKLLLRCPFPACVLVCKVIGPSFSVYISHFKIVCGNDVLVETKPTNSNYSLYNILDIKSQVNFLEYWFNKDAKIGRDSGLLSFSSEDGMYPSTLIIDIPAQLMDVEMETFMIYPTDIHVNEKGLVILDSDAAPLILPNSYVNNAL